MAARTMTNDFVAVASAYKSEYTQFRCFGTFSRVIALTTDFELKGKANRMNEY